MGDDEGLRTERLRLRPWTTSAADLARLTDLYGREEVCRWLGGPPSVTPEELVARWAAVHALDDRFGAWAIELADGTLAGTVLFKPLPNGVGEVEVGWHLHPDCWATATPPRRPARSSSAASPTGCRRSTPSSGPATRPRSRCASGWA